MIKSFLVLFFKKEQYLLLLCVLCVNAAPWYSLDPARTLVIDTSKGRLVLEMRPDLAPLAVARIKLLAREHVYDGLLFHRVIDHFVDQTGNPNNHDGDVSAHPDLAPEFFAKLTDAQIDAVATRSSDGITGFVGVQPIAAMPVAGHPGTWRAWGIYCAGVAGMGRQAEIGTANSEIFFMRDAARRLDHDYTVWARVVSGLDVVRAVAVGEPPARPDRMVSVRVMGDMQAGERPRLAVIDTRSAAFHDSIDALRRLEGADFTLCDVPVVTRP